MGCEHCYCEQITVNEQSHIKCCNCGHQKAKALMAAEKDLSYFAWGERYPNHITDSTTVIPGSNATVWVTSNARLEPQGPRKGEPQC